jgi:hypothetical protein
LSFDHTNSLLYHRLHHQRRLEFLHRTAGWNSHSLSKGDCRRCAFVWKRYLQFPATADWLYVNALRLNNPQHLPYFLQGFCPHSPLLLSYSSFPVLSPKDMARKRRQSLQALFIPPFLQSSATNRSRSHSDTGQSQLFPINSPTTPTTTTTTITVSQRQHSPQVDPFSQALYSFATTDNVVSLDSAFSFNDLLDTDPFANLSTPPPRSPTDQAKPLPQLPSLGGVLPTSTLPRSPLSPAELRAHPHTATGIKYTSATTPSSPVSGPFHLPTSPVRPAYTRPVFKSTPSLPSLRSLSQGQYVPTRKVS